MLKKERRIRRSAFPHILRHGKSVSTPHFVLKALKDKDEQTSFSVVVSKKSAGKAVVRNRLRRRVYYSLKVFLPLLKEGYRGIFSARRGADTLPFRDLKKEIYTLLTQANLMK